MKSAASVDARQHQAVIEAIRAYFGGDRLEAWGYGPDQFPRGQKMVEFTVQCSSLRMQELIRVVLQRSGVTLKARTDEGAVQ